jgi:hypothetical protein
MGHDKTYQYVRRDKNAVTYCHHKGYGINITKKPKKRKKIIKKAQKIRRDEMRKIA